MATTTTTEAFTTLPEDVLLNILFKLEDDPRHLPRLACVSTKFASLIRFVCWPNKCHDSIPDVVAHLLSCSSSHDPAGGWPALHKLAVCCPGLLHSGVLLDNSDFGLERELGPETDFPLSATTAQDDVAATADSGTGRFDDDDVEASASGWSLYDDLYMDTVYDASEFHPDDIADENEVTEAAEEAIQEEGASSACRNTNVYRSLRSHLASGVWNLSREQGNKLLASRFRGDCLYICDWPGCVHIEEKRNYMLFRGIFKDFKKSRVWRTINDANRNKLNLNCAYCSCAETWDLHSAFCLRRVYGYHDDGEPVVRAYVCENGHVSGAWTDWPLYT